MTDMDRSATEARGIDPGAMTGGWIPLAVLGATVCILSLCIHWHGDAIAFTFFNPAENEDFASIPFTSVWEVFPSMANHYGHSTGRVFSHGIAQLVSAFAGQGVFAVCNALAWVALAVELLLLSGHPRWDWREGLLTCALLFLAFFSYGSENSLPFEPPFQIDYVWMSTVALLWIWMWLKPGAKGAWMYATAIAVSLMAGLSGEVFNTAIGTGILVWAFRRRLRLTPWQWTMGSVFAAAALFELLSPGNFHRASLNSGGSPLHTVERLIPALTIPACWVAARYAAGWRGCREGLASRGWILIWTAIATNFAVALLSGFTSGTRTVSLASVLLILLILSAQGRRRISLWVSVLIAAGWGGLIYARAANTALINRQTETIEKLYAASADGVVVLPDSIFTYESNEIILRPNIFMMRQWATDPGHPCLRLRPASMPGIASDADTNLLVPTGDQGWVMIQSRRRPARFVIHKTLLPGILDRQMADRDFDFAQYPSDAVFDSTPGWRAAYYHNSRGYIRAHVTMTP